MQFEEGNLAFTFGPAWGDTVCKFDDHLDYRRMADSLPGTKAVDFVGICHNDLYLIEVKDFRGYRIQNKERLETGELANEVAQKAKDTIAAIIGAHRTPERHMVWESHMALLQNDNRPVRVILWLEQDRPLHKPAGRSKVKKNFRGNSLKPKLKWLNAKVDLQSVQDTLPDELDLQVKNLPRTTTS